MLRVFESLSRHLVRSGCALAVLGGCSPTYQSLHDGDVRFEHCYRVDEERQVPINEKLQCWREWTHRYRHGQSRDRVGYALERERTLAQALAAGEQAAPRGAAGVARRTLPQPMNPFAPPPQTMTPASAVAEGGATAEAVHAARTSADAGTNAEGSSALASETSAVPADAPGASCAGACGKTWNACRQQCKGGACRTGCDEHYRGCMRACF